MACPLLLVNRKTKARLVQSSTLRGHDILHDLIAPEMLRNEHKAVRGPSAGCIFKPEGQDIAAAHPFDGLCESFEDKRFPPTR